MVALLPAAQPAGEGVALFHCKVGIPSAKKRRLPCNMRASLRRSLQVVNVQCDKRYGYEAKYGAVLLVCRK